MIASERRLARAPLPEWMALAVDSAICHYILSFSLYLFRPLTV